MPSEPLSDDPLVDPAYHAGRSRYQEAAHATEAIGKGFLTWGITTQGLDVGNAYLTCPHCRGVLGVSLIQLTASTYRTRPCFFCFKASRLPEQVHTYIPELAP